MPGIMAALSTMQHSVCRAITPCYPDAPAGALFHPQDMRPPQPFVPFALDHAAADAGRSGPGMHRGRPAKGPWIFLRPERQGMPAWDHSPQGWPMGGNTAPPAANRGFEPVASAVRNAQALAIAAFLLIFAPGLPSRPLQPNRSGCTSSTVPTSAPRSWRSRMRKRIMQ